MPTKEPNKKDDIDQITMEEKATKIQAHVRGIKARRGVEEEKQVIK
jgi:hypothetical protein